MNPISPIESHRLEPNPRSVLLVKLLLESGERVKQWVLSFPKDYDLNAYCAMWAGRSCSGCKHGNTGMLEGLDTQCATCLPTKERLAFQPVGDRE